MPFLPPNQQRQSTEGIKATTHLHANFCYKRIVLLWFPNFRLWFVSAGFLEKMKVSDSVSVLEEWYLHIPRSKGHSLLINSRTRTTHTHTHTQLFYGSMDMILSGTTQMSWYQHLSWSSIDSYLLLPSNTIHGILFVQPTCLTDFFHNLSSFLWSTSWPGTLHFILLYFFTQSLSSVRNTYPYHCSLFCCST